MKNPAAYYLLLIYLFALCKPVMPLVQDAVAHTFFQHQHLSSVHQHAGNSHAADEVGRLAKKESTDNKAGGVKSFNAIPLHVGTSVAFHFSAATAAGISHCSLYQAVPAALPLAVQLPPPRVG